MRIERYLTPPAEPGAAARPHPVLALGFRPFFLAAGLMAALWLPLWLAIHLSGLALPLATDPGSWHAHELVFGFAGAVLAGFLLTAARNWTKRPTPTGRALLGLVALWVLGRLAMLLGGAASGLGPVAALVATLDAAFLPLVAFALARPILAAKDRRNYAFPLLVLALGGLNVAFHLADDQAARRTLLTTSLDLVVLFLVVMGGRVIPFFTRNACPQATVRTPPALAWIASLSTAALIPVGLLAPGVPVAIVALVAALANLARFAGWASRATLGNPLLWVLHLGYLWIPLGLLLRGLGPWVPELTGPGPIHALSIGALGTVILGMIARVSLGHTGRPLVAPKIMVPAFLMLSLAALLRVLLPLVSLELYALAMILSASLFALAFGIFVLVYWPILTRARVDGAPG